MVSIVRCLIKNLKTIKPTLYSSNSTKNSSRILKNSDQQLVRILESSLSEDPIVIFSKSYCPFCTRSKDFLRLKLNEKSDELFNRSVKVWELDLDSNGDMIQSILTERLKTSRLTVPQIFINSNHIGGCDDLLSLEKVGELDNLLKQIKHK
uniref:Glutaredoxin domain-containing protein n=1 Tax=Phakopsora pachyrhizi TaxID=170000 RepID=A0A0S1MJI9_PHAPC